LLLRNGKEEGDERKGTLIEVIEGMKFCKEEERQLSKYKANR